MTLQRIFATAPTPIDVDENDPSTEGKGDPWAKFKTIAKRLEHLFGTGDNAQLRRKLYMRIQQCCVAHGPDCYELVRACVASAQSADYPDRYFCRSVSSELKTLGYWENPVDF